MEACALQKFQQCGGQHGPWPLLYPPHLPGALTLLQGLLEVLLQVTALVGAGQAEHLLWLCGHGHGHGRDHDHGHHDQSHHHFEQEQELQVLELQVL